MSETVKNGDLVKVHYKGKTEGKQFDSSYERDPLEFKVGEGKMIPGFEKAILGLKKDEKTTVEITSNEAYGPRNEQLIQEVPVTALPEGAEVGMQVQGKGQNGQPLIAVIKEINEDKSILDFNHVLAGKDLEFEIELVDIISNESKNGE